MFTEPDRHFPTGFLWWVVAFATAMALIELWTGDYGDAAFQATVVLPHLYFFRFSLSFVIALLNSVVSR